MTAGDAGAEARARAPVESAAWRWARLLDAPHRMAFAAATFVLVVSSLWWALVNLASAAGISVRWSLPPSTAHGVLMTFGFMPLFFVGFLFTAGPKWLGQPPVASRQLLPPVLAMTCGCIVFALAAHGPDAAYVRSLGSIGLVAVTIGWIAIARRFARLVRASTVPDRAHASLIALAALVGVVALCAALWGVASDDFTLAKAAIVSALWGFIGLVFACVLHRMIPFFSAAAVPVLDAWRPLWLLASFTALFVVQAIGAACDAMGWIPDAAVLAVRGGVELASGFAVMALSIRWTRVQNVRIRLLAMLHVGFTWLGVALLLAGTSHLMTSNDPASSLGLAPLHAYTMGFLGSIMFAMVTRVSAGHAGRTQAADDLAWRLYWLLQVAVLVRVGAAALPDTLAAWRSSLMACAAIAWVVACVPWALRLLAWYGTPMRRR